MKLLRNIIIGIVLLLVAAAIAFVVLVFDFNPEPEVLELTRPNEATLKAVGTIDAANAQQFLDALDAPELETLLVTGGGGSVRHSVEIAQKIHDRGLELVVDSYCMSSCFNYFVPAASQTTILPDSILGFHGSAETTAEFLGPLGFMFKGDIKPERDFLDAIGKPQDMYFRLQEKRQAYVEENGLDDVNFWMIGPSFFEDFDVALNPESYFPVSQEELDEQVKRILDASDEELTLVMTSDF